MGDKEEEHEGVRWRPNVLLLMLLAYGSVIGLFVGLVLSGLGAMEAYNLVSVPFVALIGGTLAVVKDLL